MMRNCACICNFGVYVPSCVCLNLHRLCNPIGDSSRKRIYSSPVLLHFHSDESLTHKGFYLIYRAFSPESGESSEKKRLEHVIFMLSRCSCKFSFWFCLVYEFDQINVKANVYISNQGSYNFI